MVITENTTRQLGLNRWGEKNNKKSVYILRQQISLYWELSRDLGMQWDRYLELLNFSVLRETPEFQLNLTCSWGMSVSRYAPVHSLSTVLCLNFTLCVENSTTLWNSTLSTRTNPTALGKPLAGSCLNKKHLTASFRHLNTTLVSAMLRLWTHRIRLF